ncbi:MAG TPA: Mpo1-like protein [Burkholderiales bacterium]|nr:Mpo1-like protein [Burkholderiales bacterium]
MKTLEDQMSFYAAYHQDARNKATHFVGVPLIVFSLMIPLGWLRADVGGFPVSAAPIVTSALLLYYLMLDVPLGLAMGAVFALMLWGAEPLSQASLFIGLVWFLILFVGGWALQLWGHAYEGRKPALVDNLFQIFVAPIFLAAEVFFAFGLKPALHEEVQRRALQMRARAGIGSTGDGLTPA